MTNVDTDFEPDEDDEELEDLPPAGTGRSFDQFVRDNPTASIVGALMLGVILGRVGIL